MYEIIDKDLNMVAMDISDLTEKQVSIILKCFEGDKSISELIVFYDEEKDCIILNKENEFCESVESFSCRYLKADNDKRESMKERARDSEFTGVISSIISVLDTSIKLREESAKEKGELEHAEKTLKILNQQPMDLYFDHIAMVRKVIALEHERYPGLGGVNDMYCPLMYGYIEGIRAERARRNRTNTDNQSVMAEGGIQNG